MKLTTDALLEDFQPGDGTRYVIHLSTMPPGHNPMGSSDLGFAVLSILNMGVASAIPIDGHVMFEDLRLQWPRANPWTIRAAMLFLEREGKARGWPLVVDFEGCPVGKGTNNA